MLLHELGISLMEYTQNFGACHNSHLKQKRTVEPESCKELSQTMDPTAAKEFYSIILEAYYEVDCSETVFWIVKHSVLVGRCRRFGETCCTVGVYMAGRINWCWSSPAQSLLVPSPAGLMTIFYCLMMLRPWAGGAEGEDVNLIKIGNSLR
jgi:hypothetical protein